VHGPRCVAVAQATRRRARRHTNLAPLAYLLEHPSWRLAGSTEEATQRRQRGEDRRGWGAALRGTDGGETEWGGESSMFGVGN
jgi:hypothetical protein